MTLKQTLLNLLNQAITTLEQRGDIAPGQTRCQIERSKDDKNGDFSSNVALASAKALGMAPRLLAQKLVDAFPKSPHLERIDIAGPGFINFFLTPHALQSQVADVLLAQDSYGDSQLGHGQRVHLEFLSANPTGPLHVGHGRSAAYGSCVANLLRKVGFKTHCEYYVNDIGRQMKILALSVWLRYLQLLDEKVALPANAYQGGYIVTIAKALYQTHHHRFFQSATTLADATRDLPTSDPDKFLDQFIAKAQQLIGVSDFDIIHQASLQAILADIQQDLAEFGVQYDRWFHESELLQQGMIQAGVDSLTAHGFVYEQDGALWFRATELGDEKDRVLIRANGQPTYFASDVAYHLFKFQRSYDDIIDIFGADHHGYVPRIRAFLKGLGKDADTLRVLIVQFAILYRGQEKIAMSTRGGQFVTLRQLREEVGNDAARFFYVMRRPDQHLDFDLELAKSSSMDNPVYYIQYAHARICSVWRQLQQSDWRFDKKFGLDNADLLASSHEMTLLKDLERFPELIVDAATLYAPHLLTHYLQQLATHFHSYYNATKFLVADDALRQARLCLILAIQYILQIGLGLIGVSAPEAM